MEIPTECYSKTFQRRLKQYAFKLLRTTNTFPASSYDDDLLSLSEEAVQEAYLRIYKAPEDGVQRSGIQWSVFFHGFIKNIVREEGRRVYRRKKVIAGAYSTEAELESVIKQAIVPPSKIQSHQEYEDKEFERVFAEELGKFPPDPFFQHFARRQLFDQQTGRSVWEERHLDEYSNNHLRGLSTYFRWYQTLLAAVLKRWTAVGEEVKEHGQR